MRSGVRIDILAGRSPLYVRAMTTSYYAYGAHELREFVGRELGPGDWHHVSQRDVDDFATVTGDRQWIHVDPVAAASSPFGTTIVHGYFTLSLVVPLFAELLGISGFDRIVNYGLDRVRFPAPAPSDSRVRLVACITAFDEVGDGQHQMRVSFTVQCDKAEKPVCVADGLFRYVEAAVDDSELAS
jgi:acyl dehydratase